MAITLAFLTEQLELADQLLAGREMMLEPQDLPGRYGRAVQAVDRVLQVMGCEAVLAGGWAVWRHGFVGRITQDIDIVLPADRIEEFLKVAAVSGFEILPRPEGMWPKVRYKDADMKVDILPEGGRPGTGSKLAPTVIPHPSRLGGVSGALRYIGLPALIELKIAAGRGRDDGDVIELLRANPDQVDMILTHLARVHSTYVETFNQLLDRAREQRDE